MTPDDINIRIKAVKQQVLNADVVKKALKLTRLIPDIVVRSMKAGKVHYDR